MTGPVSDRTWIELPGVHRMHLWRFLASRLDNDLKITPVKYEAPCALSCLGARDVIPWPWMGREKRTGQHVLFAREDHLKLERANGSVLWGNGGKTHFLDSRGSSHSGISPSPARSCDKCFFSVEISVEHIMWRWMVIVMYLPIYRAYFVYDVMMISSTNKSRRCDFLEMTST